MRDERENRPAMEQDHGAAASRSAPPLPDINAETYPFETVQRLLDQAAFFDLYSVPDRQYQDIAITSAGNPNGVTGLRISHHLHRFDISLRAPTIESGLRATNRIGEILGRFDQRWMFIPDAFEAVPYSEPPVTLFDPTRSQRFVILDGTCLFDDGHDGFQGFGTGVTYPQTVNGRPQLAAAAVGNIMEGFGKLSGHEGTYTYCGSLSLQDGFSGSFLCRIIDPDGNISTDGTLPAFDSWTDPEPGITYVVIRGEKQDKYQKTTYNFGPDGGVNGLNVSQQLRLVQLDSAVRGRGDLRSAVTIGPVVGKMTARILFNLLNPGAPGSGVAPIPFQSHNQYSLFDRDGRCIGSFAADGGEGRTFNLKLSGAPGQAALRFGGFGVLMDGTGQFAGIEGLMMDNSVVGVAPHALSTLYLFRLHDPDGKYRAVFSEVSEVRRREPGR